MNPVQIILGQNSIEIVKDLMREYFPWRIDGDKIKYYDDLKID